MAGKEKGASVVELCGRKVLAIRLTAKIRKACPRLKEIPPCEKYLMIELNTLYENMWCYDGIREEG